MPGILSVDLVSNDDGKKSVFRIIAKTKEAADEASDLLQIVEANFVIPRWDNVFFMTKKLMK